MIITKNTANHEINNFSIHSWVTVESTNYNIKIKKNNLNKIQISYLPTINFWAGDDIKNCQNILSNISQNVEYLYPEVGMDTRDLQSKLINPYGQNPFCIDLKKYSSIEELIPEIRKYADTQTDLSSTTIDRDIRRIRLMADKEQTFPIDFLNPRVEQWNYHMAWYKKNKYNENTNKNFYGLKERKEAFYLYLDACNIPCLFFPYTLPKTPDNNPIEFPNPDIAYKMTKYNYFNDKDLNYYFQFAHLYNFIIGPRAPSEMAIMKISDIDFDSNTIEFAQPKRHGKIRKIMLPQVFVNGKTRKSIKNYVDHHRDNYTDDRYSEDYLFISPYSGKPFWHENDKKIAISRSANLGKQLNETGKQVYKTFYPYMGRHFCATATLINKYRTKHHDPIEATKDFMGHKKTSTTRGYTSFAEQYYEKYPYNWFKRILQGRIKDRGKYATKSKLNANLGVLTKIPSRSDNSPVQIRTGVTRSRVLYD